MTQSIHLARIYYERGKPYKKSSYEWKYFHLLVLKYLEMARRGHEVK